VDFRLFCATNRKLRALISTGQFRKDLYYRIAGVEITAPPLRDRLSDLEILSEWLTLRETNKRRANGEDCEVCELSPEALVPLQQHNWPGNVRELEAVLNRAVVLAESSRTIDRDHILLDPWTPGSEGFSSTPSPDGTEPRVPQGDVGDFKRYKEEVIAAHHRPYFQKLMAQSGGHTGRAVEISGLSPTYVRHMFKKYGRGGEAPVG
jgi:transcriptional regulator with PAS, ATPase and Fis domain